jgi:hypothetical protein
LDGYIITYYGKVVFGINGIFNGKWISKIVKITLKYIMYDEKIFRIYKEAQDVNDNSIKSMDPETILI